MSTYYESAQDTTITNKRAKQEIEKHSANWNEFIEDCGDKEEYLATDVLDWLGY